MNLELIRKYDKAHPNRAHQAVPRDEAPSEVHHHYHNPPCISSFCQVGPNTQHSRCMVGQWCNCPCHDDYEHWYGMGM